MFPSLRILDGQFNGSSANILVSKTKHKKLEQKRVIKRVGIEVGRRERRLVIWGAVSLSVRDKGV
jgi:hypothetical protein